MLFQERLAVAMHVAREMATGSLTWAMCWCPGADGNGFEIGVPQEVMDPFSSRRAQITPGVRRMAEEYRVRYGGSRRSGRCGRWRRR